MVELPRAVQLGSLFVMESKFYTSILPENSNTLSNYVLEQAFRIVVNLAIQNFILQILEILELQKDKICKKVGHYAPRNVFI